MMFKFNDNFNSQRLPVTYTNYYKDGVSSKGTPYAKIDSTAHVQTLNYWTTHLSPQSSHAAVGTDMTRYITVDSKTRKEVIIDADHYDGTGSLANIGNWMIDYQDRFTLVNTGSRERTITLALKDGGSIAVMTRDANGNILDKKYTISRVQTFRFDNEDFSYVYSIKVPAHSVKQVTLEYNLLANSYGAIKHIVHLA